MADPTPSPKEQKIQLLREVFRLSERAEDEGDNKAEGIAIYAELCGKFTELAQISEKLGEPKEAREIYQAAAEEAATYAGKSLGYEDFPKVSTAFKEKAEPLQELINATDFENPKAVALAASTVFTSRVGIGLTNKIEETFGEEANKTTIEDWRRVLYVGITRSRIVLDTDELNYAESQAKPQAAETDPTPGTISGASLPRFSPADFAGAAPANTAASGVGVTPGLVNTPAHPPARGDMSDWRLANEKAKAATEERNKKFRRTGVAEFDLMNSINPKPAFGDDPAPEPYEMNVYVRKGKKDGEYFLSPLTDGDCQAIRVDCDSEGVKAVMKKNQGWATTVKLVKKFHKDTGEAYVAIVHADQWRDAESSKLKTVIKDEKGKDVVVELSYDKYTLIGLNNHYSLLAEKIAIGATLGLQDKPNDNLVAKLEATKNLVVPPAKKDADPSKPQKTWDVIAFASLKKNIVSSNMRETYEEVFGIGTGKPYQDWKTFLETPQVAERFKRHLEDKTFTEIVAGSLGTKPDGTSRTITYTDTAGVKHTTAFIGQNMGFEDDQQKMPEGLIEALKKDPEALFAVVANRQFVRAAINQQAKTLAGEKENSYIDRENKALVEKGILWKPYDVRDDVVPGLKDVVSLAVAEEKIQHALEKSVSEMAILNGQKLQEELKAKAPTLGLTSTTTVFETTIPNETAIDKNSLTQLTPGQVVDPVANMNSRISNVDDSLSKSNTDLKDLTDEIRKKIEKGQDVKAAWAALEAVAGPIIKGLEESLKVMDAGFGFF